MDRMANAMANLRDADTLIGPAVAETINKLELIDADAAAVRLARQYAKTIDDADDPADALDRLGPKLLACLAALGATPAARARIVKGGAPSAGPSRLAQLREARRG